MATNSRVFLSLALCTIPKVPAPTLSSKTYLAKPDKFYYRFSFSLMINFFVPKSLILP